MCARGPCSTRSNAATRLPMHGVCKQEFAMQCKACIFARRLMNKAPLSRHAEGRDVLGWDVLPLACGRLRPGSSAPETPRAAGVERRVPCAADIPVKGNRLLLFAPSSIAHCRVCTMAARQAAGELGVHSASLLSHCCNSKRAMTFALGSSFLSSTRDSAIVFVRQYPE